MAKKSKKVNYFESASTKESQQTKAINGVKAKTQAKYNAMPKLSDEEIEKSMLEVGNVEENFPKVEKLLFKLTGIRPSENTIESRLRCMYTSANSKFISKVTPDKMNLIKELISANINIITCYPMELMQKHVSELTQEQFDEIYEVNADEESVEDVIKANSICSLKAFRAYGKFNRVGKKWPDYYDAEYTICGMADELVEFANAPKKEKSHELGDILWYFMSICEFWSATDEEIQEIIDATNAWIADPTIEPDYTKAFHKFVKLLRDDPSNVGNFDKIKEPMVGVFCTMIKYAGSVDKLSKVALENVAKIRDRIARNVVRGSGDNR